MAEFEDLLEKGTHQILKKIELDVFKIIDTVPTIIVVCLAWFLVNFFGKKIEKRITKKEKEKEIKSHTGHFLLSLVPVFVFFLHILVLIFGAIQIMRIIGVPITPIIYSLGFVGVAISFAFQDTFKDIIKGTVTLFEGKISINDFVTIGGSTGFVEKLTIREIVLRHLNGTLEAIPFSSVGTIKNHSIDFNVTPIFITINSEGSVPKFQELCFEVIEKMKEDSEWNQFFIKNYDEKTNEVIHEKVLFDFVSVSNIGIRINVKIKIFPDAGDLFSNEFLRRMILPLQKNGMIPIDPIVAKKNNVTHISEK